MTRTSLVLLASLAVGSAGSAQQPAVAQSGAATSPAATAAPAPVPPPDQQITAALLPLPMEFRDGAMVLGYDAAGQLRVLRRGTGNFVCLASDPKANRFHVACYHKALDPFMVRGRALRAQGIAADRVDTVRFAEVRSGRLRMPKRPAALYSLTGPAGSFDPATGTASGARPLFVIYIPGATGASTGLSEKPAEGTPWVMFPGTPKAHIMFVPKM